MVFANKSQYVVKIRGQDFKKKLAAVKTIKGRDFDLYTKTWTVPKTPENERILLSCGFVLETKQEEPLETAGYKKITIAGNALEGLYPFQLEGVKFLLSKNGRGIIGDEMGLGKTIQAIGYFKVLSKLRPILVVCPACMKITWEREIKKWTKERVFVAYGRTPDTFRKAEWVVANYEILLGKTGEGWANFFKDVGFAGMVIDEVQFLASVDTLRTTGVGLIAKPSMSLIALSGTPIRDRPVDFYSVLNLFDPKTFNNPWRFKFRYCDPKHNGFAWTFKGLTEKREEEFQRLVKRYAIRRLKKDVWKELPEKRRLVVYLENEETFREGYLAFETELKHKLEGRKSLPKEDLRNIFDAVYLCKRRAVLAWIKDFAASGEKLIVFAFYRKTIEDIHEAFKGISVVFYGGMGAKKRQENLDRFRADKECKIFIGQTQAAGVGLDLTAASSVAMVDLPWSSSDLEQAEDRPHRLTQKASEVNIYYLVASDSVEEKYMAYIQAKADTLNKALDEAGRSKFFEDRAYNLLGGFLDLWAK